MAKAQLECDKHTQNVKITTLIPDAVIVMKWDHPQGNNNLTVALALLLVNINLVTFSLLVGMTTGGAVVVESEETVNLAELFDP